MDTRGQWLAQSWKQNYCEMMFTGRYLGSSVVRVIKSVAADTYDHNGAEYSVAIQAEPLWCKCAGILRSCSEGDDFYESPMRVCDMPVYMSI